MSAKTDLHHLSREAYAEIQGGKHGGVRRKAKPPDRVWPAVAVALAAVLALYAAWHAGLFHLPTPTRERTQADLSRVLDQARDSVESARRAAGFLPEALPNASLAAVVHYELFVYDFAESTYRLSASSGGITVSLDGSGNRDVRQER